MKNLDCMWLRVWRTSRPCPILECASYNSLGQDGFLADQRDSDSGSETGIRDVINTIQGLDDEVLEFVGGNDSLRCSGKTLDDEEGLNGAPGGCRVGVLSPGSAAFVDECEGCDHFGETLVVFEEADDEVGGRVGRPGSDEIDGSGGEVIRGQGRTVLDRPG